MSNNMVFLLFLGILYVLFLISRYLRNYTRQRFEDSVRAQGGLPPKLGNSEGYTVCQRCGGNLFHLTGLHEVTCFACEYPTEMRLKVVHHTLENRPFMIDVNGNII